MSDFTLLAKLDELLKNVKVDKRLEKRLIRYILSWKTSYTPNLEFSGTNLLGVIRPRFTAADIRSFFDDVIGLDLDDIADPIRNLKVVPIERQITSDVYNIVCMYLIHRLLKSRLHKGAEYAYLAFGYKTFVRRYNQFFSDFNIEKDIALAVYENMSQHYIIKKTGSVEDMLLYRSKDYIDRRGVNHKRIVTFESIDVFDAIADGYGRLNSMLKSVMALTINIMEEGKRVSSVSASTDAGDGNIVVRSVTGSLDNNIEILLNTVPNTATFIDDSILNLSVVESSVTNPKALQEILEWISNHYSDNRYNKELKELITDAIVVTQNYLIYRDIGELSSSNIPMIIITIRGMWGSRRENDQLFNDVRERGRKYVKQITKRKDKTAISALSTSMFIYFFLRVILNGNH